jgi:hypothetical protein
MQKLVEEAQKIGSDSVKMMTENSLGKDVHFSTTDEEEKHSLYHQCCRFYPVVHSCFASFLQ